jgi:predicted alpha/beta hydrolase family esterase
VDDKAEAQNSKKAELVEAEDEDTKEEEPLPQFPSTIDGFGYTFNEKGQLRHKETDKPFVFVVKEGDKQYNQAHYEALGELLTDYVYDLLETKAQLQRVTLPVDADSEEPQSFVFQSEDALSNQRKLMVLIHGSGVVRAGQWARRLIINDCLDSGTQLPFIQRAKEGNSSPEEHALYVWNHIIKKAAAKELYIVAHSYGGIVTTRVADERGVRDNFQKRVKKIAFTDSVHNFASQHTSSTVKRWMVSHSRNWISCEDPLDTELMMPRGEVQKVSAGTNKHEETSYFAMESIFTYFREKL